MHRTTSSPIDGTDSCTPPPRRGPGVARRTGIGERPDRGPCAKGRQFQTRIDAESALGFPGPGFRRIFRPGARLSFDTTDVPQQHPGRVSWPGPPISPTVPAVDHVEDESRDALDPRIRGRQAAIVRRVRTRFPDPGGPVPSVTTWTGRARTGRPSRSPPGDRLRIRSRAPAPTLQRPGR